MKESDKKVSGKYGDVCVKRRGSTEGGRIKYNSNKKSVERPYVESSCVPRMLMI